MSSNECVNQPGLGSGSTERNGCPVSNDHVYKLDETKESSMNRTLDRISEVSKPVSTTSELSTRPSYNGGGLGEDKLNLGSPPACEETNEGDDPIVKDSLSDVARKIRGVSRSVVDDDESFMYDILDMRNDTERRQFLEFGPRLRDRFIIWICLRNKPDPLRGLIMSNKVPPNCLDSCADSYPSGCSTMETSCKVRDLLNLLRNDEGLRGDLLSQFRIVSEIWNEVHYGPLHFAALSGSMECVKLLLIHGASIHGCHKAREPVLHCAVRSGSLEIAKFLLGQGANVNQINADGETALHVACLENSLEFMQLLLSQRDRDVNVWGGCELTPLHYLAENGGSAKIVEMLMKKGASIDAEDNFLQTPLFSASRFGNAASADVLLAGDDLYAQDIRGQSTLQYLLRNTSGSHGSIHKILDSFITMDQPVSTEIWDQCDLSLDFAPLMPGDSPYETSIVKLFIEEGASELLLHPLVRAFLYQKWKSIRKFYLARILVCALTAICFSSYVLGALVCKCYKFNRDGEVVVGICNSTWMPQLIFEHHVIQIEWYLTVLLICVDLPVKILSLRANKTPKRYLGKIDNFLDAIFVIGVFVTSDVYTDCTYDWQRYVGKFSSLCAWTNLMLMVAQLPEFRSYVTMFTHVQLEFVKMLLFYSSLLIVFAISFCVIFAGEPSFDNPFTGFIKLVAMMTGEEDFASLMNRNETFNRSWTLPLGKPLSICSQILFVLFVLFITIILMSLFVGTAVDITQSLRKQGHLAKLERQTELIHFIEEATTKRTESFTYRIINAYSNWTSNYRILGTETRRLVLERPFDLQGCRLPKDLIKDACEIAKKSKPAVDKTDAIFSRMETRIKSAESEYESIRGELSSIKGELFNAVKLLKCLVDGMKRP